MNNSSRESLEQAVARTFVCLIRLLERLSEGGCIADEFRDARETLEALPLTTGEFAVARNRLENARLYHESGEGGAAAYELCLLARALSRK